MDWIHTLTIIGSLGALTVYICSKLDSDIKATNARADAENARIDQLYNMFVDLLKEKK